MLIKIILFLLGVTALAISIFWVISGNDYFEPWEAVVSILIVLVSFLIPNNQRKAKAGNEIKQTNFFGFLNTSVSTRGSGKTRQSNIFSGRNKQEIKK